MRFIAASFESTISIDISIAILKGESKIYHALCGIHISNFKIHLAINKKNIVKMPQKQIWIIFLRTDWWKWLIIRQRKQINFSNFAKAVVSYTAQHSFFSVFSNKQLNLKQNVPKIYSHSIFFNFLDQSNSYFGRIRFWHLKFKSLQQSISDLNDNNLLMDKKTEIF